MEVREDFGPVPFGPITGELLVSWGWQDEWPDDPLLSGRQFVSPTTTEGGPPFHLRIDFDDGCDGLLVREGSATQSANRHYNASEVQIRVPTDAGELRLLCWLLRIPCGDPSAASGG